ncbi:MAG: macB [Actinomycetia bacterium]|nr:macB [Actinomycetes bacterium]
MSWRDAFALARRSVYRRLGRAVLTILAVTLAAALLTSLLVLAGAARTRVLNQLSKGGPLAGIQVAAAAPNLGQLDRDSPQPGPPKPLDDVALRRIRALRGVASVIAVEQAPIVVIPPTRIPRALQAVASRKPGTIQTTMIGTELQDASKLPISIISGRLPAPNAQTEVAVTETFLQRYGIGKRDAATVVGMQLEIGSPRKYAFGNVRVRGRWTKQTIVGVVAQQAANGEVLTGASSVEAARSWTAGGEQIGDSIGPDSSPYAGLFVIAAGLDQIGPVRSRITQVGYSTSAPENLINSVQRYLHVIEIVLSGIGVIALVIAGLGITNAMLASVRERRREIGVLKAIGARDRDVRHVFLLEAGLLGLAGGLLGTVGGWGIARTLGSVVNRYLSHQGLVGVQVGMPAVVALGGIVGATVLALLAGTVPAQRAAGLPARQAMGDE